MPKTQMFNSKVLSKYILTKCSEGGCPISNLHLQKVLFCIQREFLREVNKAAFFDEIQAWRFGPVVPMVYNRFCGYGATDIIARYETSFPEDKKIYLKLADKVVEKTRDLAPWDIAREVMRPNGAWEQTYDGGKGSGREIPLELIREVG